MNIETIEKFLEWSEGTPYLEVYKGAWEIDECGVSYTVSDDFPEDEWEYSAEVNGELLRKDGLVLVNVDNGCGETITMVFLESEEIK